MGDQARLKNCHVIVNAPNIIIIDHDHYVYLRVYTTQKLIFVKWQSRQANVLSCMHAIIIIELQHWPGLLQNIHIVWSRCILCMKHVNVLATLLYTIFTAEYQC